MLALLVWGNGGVLDLIAMKRETRKLELKVRSLKDENARLLGEIEALKKNPNLYEGIARERFFLKKPGETVLYVTPVDKKGKGFGSGRRTDEGDKASATSSVAP